jgi:hypothetical protein
MFYDMQSYWTAFLHYFVVDGGGAILNHPETERQSALPRGTDVEKLTITPVLIDAEDELSTLQSLEIQPKLTFERISSMLSAENFSLWKDYISLEERKRLGSVTHALVYRLLGRVGDDAEDLTSRIYMNHVFICLRLIKPTRSAFQPIQAYARDNGIEVYGITHPTIVRPSMPITQTINGITIEDLQKLKSILPSFMKIAYEGPLYLQRAVRFYEQGYSATVEPALQFLSWMIGIESIISKGERRLSEEDLLKTILERFGEIDVKRPQWRAYLPKAIPLLVKTQARNLLILRNSIVHAQLVPDFLREPERDHLGISHELADFANAAAAMILQSAILQEIATVER